MRKIMAQRDERMDLADWRRYREEWGGRLTAGVTDDHWLEEMAYGWPDTPPEDRDEWRFTGIEHDDGPG